MAGAITRLSFSPVLPRELELKPSLSSRIVACSRTGAKRPNSSVGTDELRTQLLQLQAEADNTRAKANDARLRLMRLSEAAENLRRRAAADVQSGKEDEARELLLQKRKVVQALEKSKSRIQVLDELAEKLNEVDSLRGRCVVLFLFLPFRIRNSSRGKPGGKPVIQILRKTSSPKRSTWQTYFGPIPNCILRFCQAISVKETLLIGTVASDLEVSTDDPCLVRIIPPKNDKAEEPNQPTRTELFDPAEMDDEEPDFQIDVQTKNLPVDGQDKNVETPITSAGNEETFIRSLEGISSYIEFLDHLDKQLLQIEEELVTVLRVSSLVMGSDQGQTSAKSQQTLVLLEDVRGVRERISGIRHRQEHSC